MSAGVPATLASQPVLLSTDRHTSWGRYPRVRHRGAVRLEWSSVPPDLEALPGPLLPFGLGRSYGDSCLNEGGLLLETPRMDRLLEFDVATGQLRCEAGATLQAILTVVSRNGWFLPVVPGTQYVTVGGAIANDIHGKNHHRRGSFGRHVRALELLRSSGERVVCRPEGEHAGLFAATVGGLGLSGLILTAELQLMPITSPAIDVEHIRYGTLDQFFALSAESDTRFEYTVAWVDALATGSRLGRGILMRGNHAAAQAARPVPTRGVRWRVPFDAPAFLLNGLTMKTFNTLYYHRQRRPVARATVPYQRFLFPLDAVGDWNRLYGRRGFLQYQCVIPGSGAPAAIRDLLARVGRAGRASFLAVLKTFGDAPSPGMLSFPRAGLTLAIDLPFEGRRTLELCSELDAVVTSAGGALYPAKDARMSPRHFADFFPRVNEFLPHIDPKFSSSFWRRVMGG